MAALDQASARNTLLAAMDAADFALIAPHLTREPVEVLTVLCHAGQTIEHVWFPEGGVASVVNVGVDEGRTEVGIFGREGMSTPSVLLGSAVSPHEVFIQVNGSPALRIATGPLLDAVEQSATLRASLLRYVQCFLIQIAASAASNAHQRMEARLARWLLMCHDRVDGDEIALTHRFLAMMIAAERSGVTVSLHILEGSGLIRARRGRVQIVDRAKLEELAGDGYGAPEAEYRRLIAPFGRSANGDNGVASHAAHRSSPPPPTKPLESPG